MRERIVLQKHFVRNIWSALWYFVTRARGLGSAHASSRRFDSLGDTHTRRCIAIEPCLLILTLWITAFCITSCATTSRHEFSEPSSGWQTKTGQLMYRGANTTLIGDVLVRFSTTGDFQLTVSKGPGITLLFLRQDATFAEVTGAFARQGWSGPVQQAPQQLRGWLTLRDHFIHAANQKTVRYATANETFLFRF